MDSDRSTNETSGAESRMGASEGHSTIAQEQYAGAAEANKTGALEQGMGSNEGNLLSDSTDDYGMGSGRSSDQREGEVGKFFDRVKVKFKKGHHES